MGTYGYCGAKMDAAKPVDCVECRFYNSAREYCRKFEKAVFPFCFCYYGEEREREIILGKEYIERDLAEKTIDRFAGYLDDDMIFRINYAIRKHIPSADVAPVVRCKDCKHSHYWYGNDTFGNTSYLCDFFTDRYCTKVHADDFCSYGDRKENDNE